MDALDVGRHYTAAPRNSRRQRVRDNLLGTGALCPVVRRTRTLEAMIAARLADEAKALTANYPPETLTRAVNFLYTKETRSSFAIEGEAIEGIREQRFLAALRSVSTFDPTNKDELIRLQGNIVDPRYAASDWRACQNFVGETTRRYGESVHFIGPRPQDVPRLMQGWMSLTQRVLAGPLDAVLAAAVSAFAFVFIHPFEDGNGRIHRFLIHFALTKCGFNPPGILFPVSAAILRRMTLYNQALEALSQPLMGSISWSFTAENEIVVQNDTHDLYRFFDATAQAEFLYDRVSETVHIDFKEELDFLMVHDAALAALRRVVDMPDRRAALLVRLCLLNGGRLSQNKRKQFQELRDDEVPRIEAALQSVMRDASDDF